MTGGLRRDAALDTPLWTARGIRRILPRVVTIVATLGACAVAFLHHRGNTHRIVESFRNGGTVRRRVLVDLGRHYDIADVIREVRRLRQEHARRQRRGGRRALVIAVLLRDGATLEEVSKLIEGTDDPHTPEELLDILQRGRIAESRELEVVENILREIVWALEARPRSRRKLWPEWLTAWTGRMTKSRAVSRYGRRIATKKHPRRK